MKSEYMKEIAILFITGIIALLIAIKSGIINSRSSEELQTLHLVFSLLWFPCTLFLFYSWYKRRIMTIFSLSGMAISFTGTTLTICHLIGILKLTTLAPLYFISIPFVIVTGLNIANVQEKKAEDVNYDKKKSNFVSPIGAFFIAVILGFGIFAFFVSGLLDMW